jgi:chemotaxis protein histidine kinase CheA/ActR/RegA family two-component response regulator
MQNTGKNQSPIEHLRLLQDSLVNRSDWPKKLHQMQLHARSVAEFASTNCESDVEALMNIIEELVDVLLIAHADNEAQDQVDSIVEFCASSVAIVTNGIEDDECEWPDVSKLCETAFDKWDEFLTEPVRVFDGWQQENEIPTAANVASEVDPDVDLGIKTQQIGMILGALAGVPSHSDSAVLTELADTSNQVTVLDPGEAKEGSTRLSTPASPFSQSVPLCELTPPAPISLDLDQETVDAYADDAVQCVSVIESEVLRYEQDQEPSGALRQICRELHTIKGASAAIGLAELAGYLHSVEDSLEQSCRSGSQADVEVVLQSVDAVRSQLEVLVTATDNHEVQKGGSPSNRIASTVDIAGSANSIRVNASQLDRLFDMLAELVMLRNRRDSSVDQLKRVNAELLHCVSRLRTWAEHFPTQSRGNDDEDVQSLPVSSLTEIASDVLELGRTLRQTFDPISEENLILSRFINQFRSELIELRRLPIQALFNRLQRPIRDAAKAENKHVQVKFVNDQVGLERSLHEKLYEPLMHVVRNAVSHGVECHDERLAAGKSEMGTITIEAHSGSNIFVVEVRDDGKGLDYEAVRLRGIERGLISADDNLTNEEIANLIFRPGFSTLDAVSEISGRGVGMDVVAASVEELHGWVELESKRGKGTCLRLLVPRSSFIENTLVFRIDDKYFAFPTRFVIPFDDNEIHEPGQGIHLAKLLGTKSDVAQSAVPIRLASPDHAERVGVTVWVDEVIGPEEVVTRPLPALMNTQRLFTGVTLSGTGAIMLLLNAESLIAVAREQSDDLIEIYPLIREECSVRSDRLSILVAEDSFTARLTLCKLIRSLGDYEILEARDGSEALSILKANRENIGAVFTDIDMPRMTGFDLLREIEVLGRSVPVPPVTVLSSRSDQRSRETAAQFGAFHYLTKPANESAIKQVIDRAIVTRDSSQVSGEKE